MVMRSNDDHFEATLRKTKERYSSLGLPTDFESRRIRRWRAPFDENPDGDVNEPATDAKEKFKIDVYYVVLDAIITDLDTHFNVTTFGVLKSLSCLSPATLIEKDIKMPHRRRV